MEIFADLVSEKGVGLIVFQFLPEHLVQIQMELLLGIFVGALEHQVPGKKAQLVELLPQLLQLSLAIAHQGLQLLDLDRRRLRMNSQLGLDFFLQEIQLEGEDLHRGVHLVNDAQATLAHTGMAIIPGQGLKAALEGLTAHRLIRRQGRHRDGVPWLRRDRLARGGLDLAPR